MFYLLQKLKDYLFPKLTGLEELPEDKRDFTFGAIATKNFVPRQDEVILQTKSVKSQSPLNTCTWNSRTAGKEIDEDRVLSVKSLVKFGKRRGLIKENGFANLRSPEICVVKDGITEERLLPDTGHRNWTQYSQDNLTDEQKDNAKKHRSQSFWLIRNAVEACEAIEQGKTVRFGVQWMSSMNHLTSPYVLDFSKGYVVGGHAILAKGFKWKSKLIRFQNSFDDTWGDNGDAWIRFEDFDRFVRTYGAYADQDIPKDKAKWLNENNGKVIKEHAGSKVYFIENGFKRWFPDEFVLWAYGFSLSDIGVDTEGMLNELPDGDKFEFQNGKDAIRIKEIIRGIGDGRTQELAKSYFPEFYN